MVFFEKYFGAALLHPCGKWMVIMLYVVYLVFAIWGCTQLQEGIQVHKLANIDSPLVHYYSQNDKYFGTYGPMIGVVITEKLDYSNPSVKNRLNEIMKEFEANSYFQEGRSVSWLSEFTNFLDRTYQSPKNMEKFTEILNDFLDLPKVDRFRGDLNVDENGVIAASRFWIQSYHLNNTIEEKNMMLAAREIANQYNISLTVFHPAFIYYDQYTSIMPSTIQNMVIAVGCMLIVSLFLIPDPLCAIWVTVAIASIETGVIGYMTWWGVNLDSISMISLILCIGFSVDFAAHITYSYISSPDHLSRNRRAAHALYDLGYPIAQGAISTILGIFVLSGSISYIFRTFFKTMFLVIIFGAVHGLFVLPVVLSIVGFSSKNSKKHKQPVVKSSPCKQQQQQHQSPSIFTKTKQNGLTTEYAAVLPIADSTTVHISVC